MIRSLGSTPDTTSKLARRGQHLAHDFRMQNLPAMERDDAQPAMKVDSMTFLGSHKREACGEQSRSASTAVSRGSLAMRHLQRGDKYGFGIQPPRSSAGFNVSR